MTISPVIQSYVTCCLI